MSFFAQSKTERQKADSIFDKQNFVNLKFNVQDRHEIDMLTYYMSIDKVYDKEVYAYLNKQQFDDFDKLKYKYTLIQTSPPKVLSMATTLAGMSWNKYPTYEVYTQMMQDYVTRFPDLCKLESIGKSKNNRDLWVLKISDNVQTDEAEPEFFYTSTMHGDETTGYILMLRLIDSLLTAYSMPAKSTNSIVDNFEIYINPNANPDGTYYGGNNSVAYSTRYNYNGIDLNRNFPDARVGENPDGERYQPETLKMIEFGAQHNFVMSANFHGGIEVVNFPWDAWYESEKKHADRDWYYRISRNYANSAQQNSPNGYMTALDNGVTNGAEWYIVYGGRQDYMNYFFHCREITIELSYEKLLSSDKLQAHWKYNKQALIDFMLEAKYGISGIVTNEQGEPLKAKVEVLNHDKDNSFVYSTQANGDYYRPIETGTYSLKFSADGYISKTIDNVAAVNFQTTILNVELVSNSTTISELSPVNARIYPNPASNVLNLAFAENIDADMNISIFDLAGREIVHLTDQKVTQNHQLDISTLQKGSYIIKMQNQQHLFSARFMKE